MVNAPKEWSKEICSLYNPICLIGKGAFGSVWLAELKTQRNVTDSGNNTVQVGDQVAIKVVGDSLDNPSKKASSFLKRVEEDVFQREIDVLAEMNHPHIVRFIKFFKTSSHERSCAPFAMALSYHKGPHLQTLLEHGGALGLPLAKLVSKQLIDAVAYLHDHGVIHRDIKPDNIIITGANRQMDECWSDSLEAEKLANNNTWNVILIDFGFARHVFEEEDVPDTNTKKLIASTMKSSGLSISNHRRKVLDETISKKTLLDLSAVGNRSYAAPEIFKTIHKYSESYANANTFSKPLSEYVSNYAMVVDAYSVGMTIRYLITGVPASEQNIDDYISMQNHPFLVASRKMKKLVNRAGKNEKKKKIVPRKKKFRSNVEIPKEIKSLIIGLTHVKEEERTTVRAAKYHTWFAAEVSVSH